MYEFTRMDNGAIIKVSFEKMMEMDVTGTITVPVGGNMVTAIRCRGKKTSSIPKSTEKTTTPPVISSSLGIPASALAEELALNKFHGIKGVEFVPDPLVPEFLNAHIESPDAMRRYAEHLGLGDKNSRNGGHNAMTEQEFNAAKSVVMRNFPNKNGS